MRVVDGDTPSSDPGVALQAPPTAAGSLPAPGVRAARLRLPGPPTQEAIAARMNVSLHTYRRWDQGRNKPQTPELMQLLCTVLESPLEVIWPPEANPQVAVALQGERDRAAERTPTPPNPDPSDPQPVTVDPEPDVDPDPVLSPDAGEDEEPWRIPPALPWDSNPEVRITDLRLVGGAIPEVQDVLNVIDGHREDRRRRRPRPVVAILTVGAALTIGVTLTIAGANDHDAIPTSASAPAVSHQRQVQAQEQREVTAMRQAAADRDYDTAIQLAGKHGDTASQARYRQAAAAVLVRRARQAAHRGDLSLARTRLHRAQTRYDATPGGTKVQAQITRIAQQRAARTKRRNMARRHTPTPARSTAVAATPPAAAASTSAQTSPTLTVATPPPAPTPRSSSTSTPSSRGSGGSRDRNSTVDPGLF